MKKIISIIIVVSMLIGLTGCSAPKVSKEEDIINQIQGGFLYTSNLKAENDNEREYNEERRKAIEIFMETIEDTAMVSFKVIDEIEEYEENLMKYMDEIEDKNAIVVIQEITNRILANKVVINSYKDEIKAYFSMKTKNEVTTSIIDNYILTEVVNLVDTQTQYISQLLDDTDVISILLAKTSERQSDKLISSSEKNHEKIDEKYNEMMFEYQKSANVYSYIASADYYANLYYMSEVKKDIDTLKEDQSDEVKELEDLYNIIIGINSKPPALKEIPKNEAGLSLIETAYAYDALSAFAFLEYFTEIAIIEGEKYNEDNKVEIKSKEVTAMKEESKKSAAVNQDIIDKISAGQLMISCLSYNPNLQFASILTIMSQALLSKKDKLDPTLYAAISNLINNDLEEVLGDKKNDFINIIINANVNQLLEVFNNWKDKTGNLRDLNFNRAELISLLNMFGLNIDEVKVETPIVASTTPVQVVVDPQQNTQYDITHIKATLDEINNLNPSMGNDELLGVLFGWNDDVNYSEYSKVVDSGVWDYYADSENNKAGWAERSNNVGYAYIYHFPNDSEKYIEIKRGLQGENSDAYSITTRDDEIKRKIEINIKTDDGSDVYYPILVDIVQKEDGEYNGLNIKTNANSQYVRMYSLGNLLDLTAYNKGIVVKEEHHEYSTDEKTSNISIYSDNGDILETYGEKNDELDGLYVSYYEKEIIKSKIDYVEGMKNGELYIYYENGKVKEFIEYKDDKKNGELKYYYEDGKLSTHENYVLGNENGMFYNYNENEKLMREREFNDGVLDGIYREYAISAEGNSNETTYLYGQYINGEMVGCWEWGTYGEVWTAKREYSNGVMIYFQNRQETIYYNLDGTVKN